MSDSERADQSDENARIAHDLRAPLAALRTALEAYSFEPPCRELLNATAQRLEKIIQDLVIGKYE